MTCTLQQDWSMIQNNKEVEQNIYTWHCSLNGGYVYNGHGHWMLDNITEQWTERIK